MKKAWRIILVIVVIAVAVGAVSAGVGILTGADFDRIGAVLKNHVEVKYNIDTDAVVHEWIPQVLDAFRGELA